MGETDLPWQRRIAIEAARLLIGGRTRDPATALRWAAHRQGRRDREPLPSLDLVVEMAAAERRLFEGEAHAARLRSLRQTAVEAMRFLDEFSPRLVGSVLDGWAGDGAAIELELHTDDSERLLLRLAELGVRPRVLTPGQKAAGVPRPCERLAFVAGDVPIVLSVYRTGDRGRKTTTHGLRRATLAEVVAMLTPS